MENKYNNWSYGGVRGAMLGTAIGLASLLGPCFKLEVNLYVEPGAIRATGMQQGAVTVDVRGMDQGAVKLEGGLGQMMGSSASAGLQQVIGAISDTLFSPRK